MQYCVSSLNRRVTRVAQMFVHLFEDDRCIHFEVFLERRQIYMCISLTLINECRIFALIPKI